MSPLQHDLRYGTAFQRTPKEVFACIFELVTADRSIQDLRAICLVCRPWHKLAISLPKLWVHIAFSHNLSARRLRLWVQRSGDQTIHIFTPGPEIDCLTDHRQFPGNIDVPDVLLPIMARVGTLSVICMRYNAQDLAGLGWVGGLGGQTFHRLEAFSMHFSALGVEFPSTCTFPRLSSLAVGRGTCRWPLVIIPNASSTLTSLSISNVDPSYGLSIPDILGALVSAPSLEQFQLDEVEWAPPNSNANTPLTVNLENLASLSITSVDDAFDLIQPLQIPRLMGLVIADVRDDLGLVFADIARKTSTIQNLGTGIWDNDSAVQTEIGLITLLENQRALTSLAVGNASIDHNLIQRLACVTTNGTPDNWLCPQLANLALPAHVECSQEAQGMVGSRFSAGMQLSTLTLVGTPDSSWDLGSLATFVGQLIVENDDAVE